MPIRIKICGLTREADLEAAVDAGADAVGLVFYPPSPRFLTPLRARELAGHVPPFVNTVGLFVNASQELIEEVLEHVALDTLQFHGEESPEDCTRWQRPWIKAVRIAPGLDVSQYAAPFATAGARALLLDAHVEGYGGKGQRFDWNLVPQRLQLPVVLSGGLDTENIVEAIHRVRPAAVDVSSGVESSEGIKDARKIKSFIAALRQGEAELPEVCNN